MDVHSNSEPDARRNKKSISNWSLGALRKHSRQLECLAEVTSILAVRVEEISVLLHSYANFKNTADNQGFNRGTCSGQNVDACAFVPASDFPGWNSEHWLKQNWASIEGATFTLSTADLQTCAEVYCQSESIEYDELTCQSCWEILPCCVCDATTDVGTIKSVLRSTELAKLALDDVMTDAGAIKHVVRSPELATSLSDENDEFEQRCHRLKCPDAGQPSGMIDARQACYEPPVVSEVGDMYEYSSGEYAFHAVDNNTDDEHLNIDASLAQVDCIHRKLSLDDERSSLLAEIKKELIVLDRVAENSDSDSEAGNPEHLVELAILFRLGTEGKRRCLEEIQVEVDMQAVLHVKAMELIEKGLTLELSVREELQISKARCARNVVGGNGASPNLMSEAFWQPISFLDEDVRFVAFLRKEFDQVGF